MYCWQRNADDDDDDDDRHDDDDVMIMLIMIMTMMMVASGEAGFHRGEVDLPSSFNAKFLDVVFSRGT